MNNNYNVEDIARLISEDPDVLNSPTDALQSSTTTPVKEPKTAPKVPTTPAKPKPFSPFNPKPLESPEPARNIIDPKEENVFKEAYEEHVPSFTRDLYSRGHKEFKTSEHPLIKTHGAELAKEAYKYSKEYAVKSLPELANLPARQRMAYLMNMTGRALQEMMTLEAPHKKELEKLAIDAVMAAWHLPEEQRSIFKAMLKKPDFSGESSQDADSPDTPVTGKQVDLTDEINKRVTMNLLSQGAAIHNMYDLHFQEQILERINKISPRLAEVYSIFGRGSAHAFWMYDLQRLLAAGFGAPLGSTHVTNDNQIVASAPIFPVLVQELIKGMVMLISRHQFNDMSQEDIKSIIKQADTIRDEFPQIMIGPRIWKAFVLSVPANYRKRLPEVLMVLAKSHPKELHEIFIRLGDVVKTNADPKDSAAASALNDLIERTLAEKEEAEEEIQSYDDGYEENDDKDEYLTDEEDDKF